MRMRCVGIVTAWIVCVSFFGGTNTGNAAPQSTDIVLEINGEVVDTRVPPHIRNGETFVPIRTLFDPLGITLTWEKDTGTIRGMSSTGTVELRLNSLQASMNGKAYRLNQPPFVLRGVTLVPLRFISEASEARVTFDRTNRKISIITPHVILPRVEEAVEKKAITALYNTYVRYTNAEDITGVLGVIHLGSPIRKWVEQTLTDAYARRDVRTEVVSLYVERVEPLVATMRVVEQHTKRSGAFYMNQEVETRVTLHKELKQGWKIYNAQPLDQRWLKEEELLEAPNISATLKTNIRQWLQTFTQALTKERMEDLRLWYDATTPHRVAMNEALQTMFDTYDFIHELEDVRILEQTKDELYVYSTQTTRKISGPAYTDVRTQTIHTLRLQEDGTWKLYATSHGPMTELSGLPPMR